MTEVRSLHEQCQQYLHHSDKETESGADDLHKAEFFGQDLVQHHFQPVGGEAGDLLRDNAFEVQVVLKMGNIVLHDNGEKIFQLLHEDGLELIDGFIPDEHRDHRHTLLELVAEKIVDMFFGQGEDLLDIGGVSDGLFDIPEGEEFLSDDAAKAFCDLLLAFGKDAVEGESKDLSGASGVKEEFERHPNGQPVYKGGDKGYGVKPPGHFCHRAAKKRQKCEYPHLLRQRRRSLWRYLRPSDLDTCVRLTWIPAPV